MPRKQKLHHYIYKTTCQVTGKFYVGMHSTDNADDGYLGSGKVLGYSRKKYGDENHKKEILEFCHSREALKLREKEIVNEELLAHPLNINLKYGGEGGGKFWSENQRKAASTAGNKSCKRNHKSIVAKAVQTKNRNGNGNFWGSHITYGMLGRTQTLKTRTKMSNAQIGILNSQFGTCWVTKDKPIKIKKEHLQEYLSNGYSQGRILRGASTGIGLSLPS